jgi:brefeldin A-resistance guanine nucleotide exchange factor 1
VEALAAAIRALEALAHERTVARLKQESDENAPTTLPYDPASVFLLETMVTIACQTPQHIDDVWCVTLRNILCYAQLSRRPIIMEHLSALLSTPEQYSILLIERAVVSLLRLGRILALKVQTLLYALLELH